MGRRTATKNGKKYSYYVCSTYKSGKGCSSHSIECGTLDQVVLDAISNQVNMVVEMEQLLKELGTNDVWKARVQLLDTMIAQKNEELEKYQQRRMGLYEALNDGVIDRAEYNKMRAIYAKKIEDEEQDIRKLADSRDEASCNAGTESNWVSQFVKFQGVESLTREIVFTLVDKIYVYADKRIKIDYN